MAVLSSTLLPLRLFLCFGLLCSSASSADDIDSCMLFSEVTTTGQGIMANSDVYESNTNYTGILSPPKCVVCSHPCDKTMPPWMMAFLRSASEHFTNIPFGISHTLWVPVNANITSVVLRAVDENNNSLGLWEKVDELCNNSVLYHLENPSDELFTASWVSPNSTNITTITLQAFAINFYDVATFSSLQLERKGTTTSQISTTRTTSHPTPTTKHISTTTTPHSTPVTKHISTTKTTPHPIPRTTNLANRTFLCPITSAIQILLVFLTSKLLS